jgi:signal transduction histidine kinase
MLLLSLVLQGITAMILAGAARPPGVPAYWMLDSLWAIALSASLSLGIMLSARRGSRVGFLIARIVVYAILVVPQGDSEWAFLGMALSIIIDAAATLPSTWSALAGCTLVSLGCLRCVIGVRAWGKIIPGSLGPENLQGLVILVLMLALTQELLRLRRGRVEDKTLIKQLNDSILALTSANIGFLNYASKVERDSIVKERNRLTRDIHDAVSYTLTNIRMMMEAALRRGWDSEDELAKLHEWTRDQAQKGLQETRSILYLIRSMEEPAIRGVREIQSLVQTFVESTRVNVVVDWGNIPWSWQNDYINSTVFRIIQEGMTNAFRHGHATEIKIYFFQNEEALNIRIEDNGIGSEDFKKGIGLTGMEERLRPIEGSVNAYNTSSGFRLLARLPIGASLRAAGATDETVTR